MNTTKFLKIFTVGLFLLSLGDSGHFYAAEAKKAGNKGVIFSSPGFPPRDARYATPPEKFPPDFRPPNSQRPNFPPPGFQPRDARYAPPPGKFPPADFRPPDSQRPDFPPDEFMPPWDVPAEPRGPEVNVETKERPTMVMLDAAKKKGIIIDWEVALAEGNIDNAVMSEFYFRKEDGSVLDETPIAFTPTDYYNRNLIGTAEKSLRAYSFSSSANFLYYDYYGSKSYYQAKTTYTPDALASGYYLNAENKNYVAFNFVENGIEEQAGSFLALVAEPEYNPWYYADKIPVEAYGATDYGVDFIFYPVNLNMLAPIECIECNPGNDYWSAVGNISPVRIRFPDNLTPYLVSPGSLEEELVNRPYYVYEKTSSKLYRLVPEVIPRNRWDSQYWESSGGWSSYAWGTGTDEYSLDAAYQEAKAGALNSITSKECDNCSGGPSSNNEAWGRCNPSPEEDDCEAYADHWSYSFYVRYSGGGVSLKNRATIRNSPVVFLSNTCRWWETDSWFSGDEGCCGPDYGQELCDQPPAAFYWAEDKDTLKYGMGNLLGISGMGGSHNVFNADSLTDNTNEFYIGAGSSAYGMQIWNGNNPPLLESLQPKCIGDFAGLYPCHIDSVWSHTGSPFSYGHGGGGGEGVGDFAYKLDDEHVPATLWDADYQYKVEKEIDLSGYTIEAMEYGDRNSFFGWDGYFNDDDNHFGIQSALVDLFGPFLFQVEGIIYEEDGGYRSYNGAGNLYGSFPFIKFQDAPFFPDFVLSYHNLSPWSMVFNTLGRGWTHSYDMFVSPVKGWGDDQYALKRPDGGITWYQKQAGEGFYSPDPENSVVESAFDNGNRLYEEEFGGEYRYRLIRRTGEMYFFNNWGRLIKIEDLHGNRVTLTYDKQKLIKIEDNYGRKIELEYTQDDMLKTVIGPQQTFDIEHANPTYITKITNRQTQESYQFGYTDNLVRDYALDELINSYTGPDGVNYQIEYYESYDPYYTSRIVKKVTNANRGAYEIAWSGDYDLEKTRADVKDWNGNLTKHEYDYWWYRYTGEFTVTDPLGYKTVTKFGNFDQVLSFKDKNGNLTNYTYTKRPDTHALLLDEIDYPSVGGEAISESFTYYDDPGGFHWLNTHTDPEGNKTTYNRDLATGFVTSMVDGENKEWKYTPHGTAKGKVASVEDPNHHITTYDYDAWGYLNKVDPPGPTPATTFVNNIMGLPTKKTDAKGNSTDYFYDGAMRVTDVYVDK